MLIFDFLINRNPTSFNNVCMIHNGQTVFYSQFKEDIFRLAQKLSSKLSKGKKLLIIREKSIDQLLYMLAATVAGVIPIIADIRENNKNILGRLTAKIQPDLVIDNSFIFGNQLGSLPEISAHDIFLGALSSGTTGDHKVIFRDHASWVSAFPHQSRIFNIKDGSRLFVAGSLAYTANLNSVVHMLNSNGSVVLTDHKNPLKWASAIRENNVDNIFMVPTNYRRLLHVMEKPMSFISSVVSAGEKLDPSTAMKLKVMFPNARITEYYGASELGHVSFLDFQHLIKGNHRIGKPFPEAIIKIVNGEIYVESPYVAPAYRPKHSVGDKGYFDEEGFLCFEGRNNDIINKAGVKISPAKIENALLTNPFIDDAVAFGVDHSLKGSEIYCLVVVKNSISKPGIRKFLKGYLTSLEMPNKIFFVSNIERNSNGKVNRQKLKEKYFSKMRRGTALNCRI